MGQGRRLNLKAAGKSEINSFREVNQDAFFYRLAKIGDEWAGIFSVADGVGGLSAGEIASANAVNRLVYWWEGIFPRLYGRDGQLMSSFSDCYRQINRSILQISKDRNMKIATTLSSLLCYKEKWYVAHVGDSRIYRLARRGLLPAVFDRLTVDHSKDVVIEENGRQISRSYLTACMGRSEELPIYINSGDLRPGQTFLICSDGLYKSLPENGIRKLLLSGKELTEAADDLIGEAVGAGEKDNITVLLLSVK